MKRFITYILLFFSFIFVIDRVVGIICDQLYAHADIGDSYHNYTVFNRVNADIIILGSSRALHHYVPSIIEDSLGLSCYNCAYDNQGIINMYGRYKMIAGRKKPQYVICEILPSLDIYKDVDDIKYLSSFKPFSENQDLTKIIKDYSLLEYIKTKSYLYRYNTFVFQILKDYVTAGRQYDSHGYAPTIGTMNYEPKPYQEKIGEIDTFKVKYIHKLIDDTQKDGVKLIFSASPLYRAVNDKSFGIIKDICKKKKVPFVSLYTFAPINQKKEYFKDPTHLNKEGAENFTKKLISILPVH